MYIVTHVSPDWDAITAVWLLQRYGGLGDADVRFVNTGDPSSDVLTEATAVVDTGRALDPERLRFDHHHLPGAEASATCAAFQVFEHIAPNGELAHLAPLNALILNGDTGGRNYGAEWSRLTGIHALLSARKARGAGDLALMAWGMDVLDDLDTHLCARYEARQTLDAHMVYRSADGLLVALKDAPAHASSAAFEAGARLVVFQHTDLTIPTHAIGIWRASEWREPHCGELVGRVLGEWAQPGSPITNELSIWYRHEAGFFAGRGTAKAPNPTPIAVDLAEVARAIDGAWQR